MSTADAMDVTTTAATTTTTTTDASAAAAAPAAAPLPDPSADYSEKVYCIGGAEGATKVVELTRNGVNTSPVLKSLLKDTEDTENSAENPLIVPNCTDETLEAIGKWMALHWPEGEIEWPADPELAEGPDPFANIKPIELAEGEKPPAFDTPITITPEDSAIVGEIDNDQKFENLSQVADFLRMYGLFTACAKKFGLFVLASSRDQIREKLGVTEEYEPAEYEEVQKAIAWAKPPDSS